MKIGYSYLNKGGPIGATLEENLFVFVSTSPVIVQPLEIQKVPINMTFRIEKGYVLNISTHPSLYERAGEIFPAFITLDHRHEDALMLPVRNNGRNPLNILPGETLAVGYVTRVYDIEPYELEPVAPKVPSKPKSRPQKKNSPFNFEIK